MTLRFEAVSHLLGGRQILRDLSFEAGAGELVALLGANGSGKSTLLRLAARLDLPEAGTITGVSQSQTGYCPQTDPLWPDLTAREHLDLLGAVHRMPRTLRRDRTAHLLGALDLSAHLDKPAAALSGGMRRRLSVAIALLHAPALLLLDEPFAGLDGSQVDRLESLIAETAQAGATVLLATHDLAQASRLTRRFLLLRDGALLRAGATAALAQATPPFRLALSLQDDAMKPASDLVRAGGFRAQPDGATLHVSGHATAALLGLAAEVEQALPGAVLQAVVRPVQLDDLLREEAS